MRRSIITIEIESDGVGDQKLRDLQRDISEYLERRCHKIGSGKWSFDAVVKLIIGK